MPKISVPELSAHPVLRGGLVGGPPVTAEMWLPGKGAGQSKHRTQLVQVLANSCRDTPWTGPERTVCFIADPHADAEAFVASLVASGGICPVEDSISSPIVLTKSGRSSVFVIGGDCLDKGPSNLALLRRVRELMDTGARVKLIAGNHDVRLLLGLQAMNQHGNPRSEHFFVRMGPKVMPLFREVYDEYLRGTDKPLQGVPDAQRCRELLCPGPDWAEAFAEVAKGQVSEEAIARELHRTGKKIAGFERACADSGLSVRELYASARQCQHLFLAPEGEFAWFFRKMRLAYRGGSLLFIHAGLDDRVVDILAEGGVATLNKLYRKQIRQQPFNFYYGPLANTLRTKYRPVDMPLTDAGVARICQQGIHAVVHGHRNRIDGQRIALRQGMIHFEGDTTLDRHSREKEGLSGFGVGVTVFQPDGRVVAVSSDYPRAKIFHVDFYSEQ